MVRSACGAGRCLWETANCQHVFGGEFVEADFSHWVLKCRQLGARCAWSAILAELGLREVDLAAVWVTVNIYVSDAHCDCWKVCVAWWVWFDVPISDRSLMCSWVVEDWRCGSSQMELVFLLFGFLS